MVNVTGMCSHCYRVFNIDLNEKYKIPNENSFNNNLICTNCYNIYYSIDAIRDKKLKYLLKTKNIGMSIINIFRKKRKIKYD